MKTRDRNRETVMRTHRHDIKAKRRANKLHFHGGSGGGSHKRRQKKIGW